jgi:hypothetical protein
MTPRKRAEPTTSAVVAKPQPPAPDSAGGMEALHRRVAALQHELEVLKRGGSAGRMVLVDSLHVVSPAAPAVEMAVAEVIDRYRELKIALRNPAPPWEYPGASAPRDAVDPPALPSSGRGAEDHRPGNNPREEAFHG